MNFEAVGKTDVGLVRGHNEDSYLVVDDQQLYVLADGMGGHNAGEVASMMAVETVAGFFDETTSDDDITWPFRPDRGLSYHTNRIRTAVKLANLRIYEAADRVADKKGMGTTFAGIYFYRDNVIVSHVGDSRVYRLRDKKLEQVTEDHSLLNDYLRTRDLTPEEIENFPRKNVILRALGMKNTVQVDAIEEKYHLHDIYLLCSDGLTDMVTDAQIESILLANINDLERAGDELIQAANDGGGKDNITALLVRVID